MANYNTLAANVAAVVRQNGVQAITGDNLQAVILACINSLGTGYQFKGVATPDTVFGSPDERLFYLAYAAGTYGNMPVVTPPTLDGTKLWLFVYSSEWATLELDIPTDDGLTAALASALSDYAKKDGVYDKLFAGSAAAIRGAAVAILFNSHALPFGVGDNYAKIKTIKGNSILWAQIAEIVSADLSASGVIATKTSNSIAYSGEATATYNKRITENVQLKSGHRYLITLGVDIDLTNVSGVDFGLTFIGLSKKKEYLYDSPNDFASTGVSLRINSGYSFEGTVHPQIIDLTVLFGSGREPSTVGEFRAIYPLDYDFSALSIRSVSASALVSKTAADATLDTLALPITTATSGGVVIFADGMHSVGSTCDELTNTTATKRIGKRAYQAGDESDSSVVTDGTNTLYVLGTPEEYTLDTPLDLRYLVQPGGSEAKSPADTASSVSAPLSLEVEYPQEAAESSDLKNLLDALKAGGAISAYTMTWNATTGHYDFTVTA